MVVLDALGIGAVDALKLSGAVLGKRAPPLADGGNHPLGPDIAVGPVVDDDVKAVVLGDNDVLGLRVPGDAEPHLRNQLKVQAVWTAVALDVVHGRLGLGDLLHEGNGNLADLFRVEQNKPVASSAGVQKLCPGVGDVLHVNQVYRHVRSPFSGALGLNFLLFYTMSGLNCNTLERKVPERKMFQGKERDSRAKTRAENPICP